MAQFGERLAIEQLQQPLLDRFSTQSAEQVTAAIDGALARFDECPVRDVVPLFVERRVIAQVNDAAPDADAARVHVGA